MIVYFVSASKVLAFLNSLTRMSSTMNMGATCILIALLLATSNALPRDCKPDENSQLHRTLRHSGKAVSALNTAVGTIWNFAVRAIDNNNDIMFKCFTSLIQDAKKHHQHLLLNSERHQHQEHMLELLIEANTLFLDCKVVRDAYREYHDNKEYSTKSNFLAKCRDKSPKDAVTSFAEFAKMTYLFEAMVNGTNYDDSYFTTVGISLLNETAKCAVLTSLCRSTLYPRESVAARMGSNKTIFEYLTRIAEAFQMGRIALQTGYRTTAEHELQHLLSTKDFEWRRQEAIDEIHSSMTNKYPYRAWTLIIFDEKDDWGNLNRYVVNGNTKNVFIIIAKGLVLIAHSSDRANRMCDQHRKVLRTRKLRQVLANYHRLTEYNDNLHGSLDIVKEWMQENEALPVEDYSLIAVGYTVSFVFKTDEDNKQHHFEYIYNSHEILQVDQCILIGWC